MHTFTAYGESVVLYTIDQQGKPVTWSNANIAGHLALYPDRSYLTQDFYIEVVRDTIQNPYQTSPGTATNSVILYSNGITDPSLSQGTLFMRVVVAQEYYPSRVKSALLTDRISGITHGTYL